MTAAPARATIGIFRAEGERRYLVLDPGADRQGRGGFRGRSAARLRLRLFERRRHGTYRLGIELASWPAAIGVQVEFPRIDGGGHVSASKDGELPWLLKKILGPMNHDVDTADEAWRFFRTKTR